MTPKRLPQAIQVHVRDAWASVPVRLMEAGCGLSPEARLALIYMLDLGRRPGWTIYVAQVQRALGLGPRRWPRIRHELEAGGYFVAERGHAENGDWRWTYHLYDTPSGAPDGIHAKCGDADCADAIRMDRRNLTSPSSTGRSKTGSSSTCERADGVATATRDKAAAASACGEGKKPGAPWRVVDGVRVYPSTDDAERLDSCRAKVDGGIFAALVTRLPRPVYVSAAEAAVDAYVADRAREAAEAEQHARARGRCETQAEAARKMADTVREYAQASAP